MFPVAEDLRVPRRRRRVAGDHHDLLRPHPGDAVQHRAVASFPGRVDDDDVRAQPLFRQLPGCFRRVGAEEFRPVGDAVAGGVLPGAPGRLRHHFDADQLFHLRKGREADGADAAVKV